MRKLLIILFFLITTCFTSEAGDNYPFSYELFEVLDGGKLVINESSKDSLTYFIKPSWAGETETISVWNGIKREKIKGTSLNGVNIQSAYSFQSSLLLIWEEKKRFFISLIDSMTNILSVSEIHSSQNDYIKDEIEWIKLQSPDFVLILINGNLFSCNISAKGFVNIKFISSNVTSAAGLTGVKKYNYAYMKEIRGWTEVYYANTKGFEKLSARIQLSSEVYLFSLDKYVGIISTNKYSNNSWLHIIDSEKGIIDKRPIMANGKLITIFNKNGKNYLGYLSYNNRVYNFSLLDFKIGKIKQIFKYELTRELIEAKKIFVRQGIIYLLFRNGLITLNSNGAVQSLDYYPFGETFEDIPEITHFKDYLIFSSPTTSLVLSKKANSLWWLYRFLESTGKIIFPLILIVIIVLIYRKYRKQRRLLKAVIDLPSSGVVFFLDRRGRLSSTNESGKKILGITEDVPMRRVFQYYCDPESTKGLKDLVDKAINLRTGFTQKIEIIKDNSLREWYFSVVTLGGLSGNFRGFVLTGVDITEELERKRLHNWAQLAHDMQTNLSTIRLNAEQLDCVEDTINLGRRKKIIHQVVLLIQRVRDIVTVGRSSSPELQYVNAADICIEVRNEFDDIMFPGVKFEVNLKDKNIYCDKPKMIRALRNAVENGIRALKDKEGSITISNWWDARYSYFSVKDTGTGMDEIKKKKMMTPYFSTSTKKGGAGIGTMIMQNVMEQHGGMLEVISEPGKGTEIIMSIPNLERSNRNKNND
ncbi:PAS domain-containing sensor histidine kinase [Bacteroidota bacterium]